MKKQVTIPIFIAHQGCPHQCVFCNQYRISGTSKAPRPDSINKTIEEYLTTVDLNDTWLELAFFGGSFTALDISLQEDYLKAVLPWRENGTLNGLRLSTRPDAISQEILDLLLKYQVTTVELGIQSFNDNTLLSSNRGHTAADSRNAIDLIKKNNLGLVIQLMLGLPGDSNINALDSANEAIAYKPQGVRLYPTVVFPDTRLAEMYNAGTYTPLNLEAAVELTADLVEMFDNADIPVIRTGLHTLEFSEANSILAGPYHTAFGFMVKSRIKRRMLVSAIKQYCGDHPAEKKIAVSVPVKEHEEYIGLARSNIYWLKKAFADYDLAFLRNKEISEIKINLPDLPVNE